MNAEVTLVQIRGILPAHSGAAIFLGNEEKVFIIQVEAAMAQVIGNFLSDAPKERPSPMISCRMSFRDSVLKWSGWW